MPTRREQQTGVIDQLHTTMNGHSTPYYPVVINKGTIGADAAAMISQGGATRRTLPVAQHRKWTNLGYNDVQLRNGVSRGETNGRLYPYYAQVFAWAYMPRIPGQTRGDVAGFHKRGPSTYNIQDMLMNGPGSQPEHPGGPGQLAGNQLYNPMTG